MPARLVREGVDESVLSDDLLADLLRSMDRGEFAKEAAIDVLRSVCRGESESVQAAVKNLGLTGLGEDESEDHHRSGRRKEPSLGV